MGSTPSITLHRQSEYEKEICSIVNDVIKGWKNEIQTYNDLIITPFKIEIKQRKQSIILPKFLYIHLVNMAIQEVTEYDISYIESIYKLAQSDISCTGSITVRTFKDEDQQTLFLNFKKDMTTNVMDHKSENVIKKFIKPFMVKIDQLEGKCPFISLAVNFNMEKQNASHANIVLILKKHKDIKFLLYEPHGADGNKSTYQDQLIYMQQSFSTFLIQVFRDKGYTATRIDPKLVSCPVGIQRYMKDDIGYCSTISSLWIYIVLMVMNKTRDKFKFFDNLNIIETCFYTLNDNNPKKVYDMVVNFTRYFIENFYSEHMIPDCKDVKRKLKPLLLATTQPVFSKTNFERFIESFKKEFDKLDKSKYPQIITVPADTDDFVCPLSPQIHISTKEQHHKHRKIKGFDPILSPEDL